MWRLVVVGRTAVNRRCWGIVEMGLRLEHVRSSTGSFRPVLAVGRRSELAGRG